MIDDIVEMVLKEARRRKGPDIRQRIISVHSDVWGALVNLLDTMKGEERRKKEDEKKANQQLV